MSLLASVTTAAPNLPSRVVIYSGEGMGKTSLGCFAPKPIFLMTRGETGLLSLIESGQVPPTAHFPADFGSWGELTGAVQALLRDRHDFGTLVLDTGNGAESMLMEHVCAGYPFNNDWNEFASYGRGIAACVPQWNQFLTALDQLRVKRRMAVLFLHHAKVKSFSNPTGKDWDQWKPECQDKLWALTHKWADVIAYYGLKVKVNKDDKVQGDEVRFLRITPSAAIVAKNRYGMPDEITAPAGAANLWKAFATALGKAKSKGRQPEPAETPAAEPHPQPQQQPDPEPAPAAEPDDHDAAAREFIAGEAA